MNEFFVTFEGFCTQKLTILLEKFENGRFTLDWPWFHKKPSEQGRSQRDTKGGISPLEFQGNPKIFSLLNLLSWSLLDKILECAPVFKAGLESRNHPAMHFEPKNEPTLDFARPGGRFLKEKQNLGFWFSLILQAIPKVHLVFVCPRLNTRLTLKKKS